MSKRSCNIIFGVVALLLGGLLYILFRPDTYLSGMFCRISFFRRLAYAAKPCSNDFIKYYSQDFLWAFSLSCFLNAVIDSSRFYSAMCCFAAFLCGCVWEFLQKVDLVSGFFDLTDIIMYLLASVVCFLINFRRENYEQI